MRRGGLDPPPSRLSAGCSASELTARHLTVGAGLPALLAIHEGQGKPCPYKSGGTGFAVPIAGLRIELRSSGYEPDRSASPSHPQRVLFRSTPGWIRTSSLRDVSTARS